MSKRVSNKSGAARPGKVHGRQRVRYGWRKRKAMAAAALWRELNRLNEENASD